MRGLDFDAVDRPDFDTVLRGYEPGRIDHLVRRAADALPLSDPAEAAEVRAALAGPALVVVPRGYDRAHLRKLHAHLIREAP